VGKRLTGTRKIRRFFPTEKRAKEFISIVGLIAGFVAKSVMHMHMTLLWMIVLGIVGSIVGGCVNHMFSRPKEGAQFHPAGIIFSILGALLVLFVCNKLKLDFPGGIAWEMAGSWLTAWRRQNSLAPGIATCYPRSVNRNIFFIGVTVVIIIVPLAAGQPDTCAHNWSNQRG